MSHREGIQKVPVIHIGLPKAASTFIRRAYFSHMSDNVVVPRGRLIDELLGESFDPDSYRQLMSQNSKGSDRLIFSGENLSGSFWDDKIAATVARNLHQAYPQARILIVLREQLDYLRSAYSFCLTKGYRMSSFDKFVLSKQADLISKCDYAKLVRTYRDLFGASQIKVLLFEQFKTKREAFDRELKEFCQMELKYEGLPNRRNASIRSASQLEAIRRVNNMTFPLIKLEKLIKRAIFGKHTSLMRPKQHFTIQDSIVSLVCKCTSSTGGELEFPADFLDEATSVIKTSNVECSDILGVDLSAYGYMV